MADADTLALVRNRSDELAIEHGCRFDTERAEAVITWIEHYCNLYEGSRGPMKLADWQREATMRIFGWVKWSPRLQRWVRRFTRASVWIPKKNGKTPTAAAWALYLLAGDGEPGQKVFFAAADGQQARIAGKHALEMVKASLALSDEIAINLNEMKLSHLPTLSEAKPISSGDNRASKAKQGLNGSVIIDEVHVVTREFISESSIDRAGASRDEPLHIEVSTAGKDPDGYGKQQYDYGKQVESGDIEDQAFFFLCYEAPQSLKDEDLDADPVKWGRMANPTWGRIIQEDEYLADYRRSKRSLADLADFKTFRLNIWQSSASPWLRMDDWRACAADFTETDMLGMSCCAGLDLSKTRDMTALVLAFACDGTYRLLPYFFLPSAGVQRLAVRIPQILDWVKRGHVIETEGDVLDYGFVRRTFEDLANKFRISKIIFDKSFGSEFVTQEIAGTVGVEALEFNQGILAYTQPTNDFERLVISHGLEHNNNPVLNWQIGHVSVKTDANQNKKPVKPKLDDHKKIDGVVAAIMGLAGAMKEDVCWYSPGSMT